MDRPLENRARRRLLVGAGAFAFVGSAPAGGKGSPHHSSTFDIDEESLVIGTELLTRTALRYLEGG